MDIMFDRLMLMELRENVTKVDTKAFAELRSYQDPPRIVHDILKAVTAIFSMKETEEGLFDDWQQMKGVSRLIDLPGSGCDTYFSFLGFPPCHKVQCVEELYESQY